MSGLHYISIRCFIALVCLITGSPGVLADQISELQKRLNAEVLDKSFSVADDAKLNAYITEATKQATLPRSEPSRYWRRGYTCADLRGYSWTDYRDCSYYYRYYGYYWPY
ncbi:MAG: hypothetical protein ACRERU_19370 [Methylococcales bacterium]